MTATTPPERPDDPALSRTDHDARYDICVRTADAGQDARGQYSTDALTADITHFVRARGLYDRPGFHEILVAGGWGIYLGRSTSEAGRDSRGRA